MLEFSARKYWFAIRQSHWQQQNCQISRPLIGSGVTVAGRRIILNLLNSKFMINPDSNSGICKFSTNRDYKRTLKGHDRLTAVP